MTRACCVIHGGPNGIRTRVTDVRGQCPRPLDDGTPETEPTLFNLKLTKKQMSNQALNVASHHTHPNTPPLEGGEIFALLSPCAQE
jgi:hypothetical protein